MRSKALADQLVYETVTQRLRVNFCCFGVGMNKLLIVFLALLGFGWVDFVSADEKPNFIVF